MNATAMRGVQKDRMGAGGQAPRPVPVPAVRKKPHGRAARGIKKLLGGVVRAGCCLALAVLCGGSVLAEVWGQESQAQAGTVTMGDVTVIVVMLAAFCAGACIIESVDTEADRKAARKRQAVEAWKRIGGRVR